MMHILHTQENFPISTSLSARDFSCDSLRDANRTEIATRYLGLTSFIERLHRLLLDVIKDEFERLGIIDVTSVQALLLYNIGDQEVTASELRSRGYYQGSNVSYNLKKLIAAGYIHQEPCSVDRRSVRVRLTAKGVQIRQIVCDLWDRHIESFAETGVISVDDFEAMCRALKTLEHYWSDQIRYIY